MKIAEPKPSGLPSCFKAKPAPKATAKPSVPVLRRPKVEAKAATTPPRTTALPSIFKQKAEPVATVKISKVERTACSADNTAPRSKAYKKEEWYHPDARLAARRSDSKMKYEDYLCPHCGRFLTISLKK